jgi:hypothetical protein
MLRLRFRQLLFESGFGELMKPLLGRFAAGSDVSAGADVAVLDNKTIFRKAVLALLDSRTLEAGWLDSRES